MDNSLKVVVCKGPTCSLLNGGELEEWCRDLEAAGLPVSHEISGCTGNCLESPVVQWNGCYLTECSPAKLTEQLMEDGLM
ncbi:MAG: hypothetical protein QNK37_33600 [Acidobacteriota bacterium]|nr:hypothetical protein [Acidobacteriota bacterium]